MPHIGLGNERILIPLEVPPRVVFRALHFNGKVVRHQNHPAQGPRGMSRGWWSAMCLSAPGEPGQCAPTSASESKEVRSV